MERKSKLTSIATHILSSIDGQVRAPTESKQVVGTHKLLRDNKGTGHNIKEKQVSMRHSHPIEGRRDILEYINKASVHR